MEKLKKFDKILCPARMDTWKGDRPKKYFENYITTMLTVPNNRFLDFSSFKKLTQKV
jgi:hypothetical protein